MRTRTLIGMTSTATNLADASQNLRSGTNFLIRDLAQAGRGIPNGGIPIPNGAESRPILRPSPPGLAYTFDNTTATTLMAITTGSSLGPTVNNQATDMITILMIDPILDACLGGPISVNPPTRPDGTATRRDVLLQVMPLVARRRDRLRRPSRERVSELLDLIG